MCFYAFWAQNVNTQNIFFEEKKKKKNDFAETLKIWFLIGLDVILHIGGWFVVIFHNFWSNI